MTMLTDPTVPCTRSEMTLTFLPWPNEHLDVLGHDARSPYAERFWLGVIGPSCLWLLRSIAYGFEASPDGFETAVADLAGALGLGDRCGQNSPIQKALVRLGRFGLAYPVADDMFRVPCRLGWVDSLMLQRLPAGLAQTHDQWIAAFDAEHPDETTHRQAFAAVAALHRRGVTPEQLIPILNRTCPDRVLADRLVEWARTTPSPKGPVNVDLA